MIPPNATKTEKESMQAWMSRRRRKGLPEGCYGLWKWLAALNAEQRQRQFMADRDANRAKGQQATRKRPAWCSARLWQRWGDYKRKICASIPLDIYADPVRRDAWKRSRLIRDLTPREKAAALLRRKGLAP